MEIREDSAVGSSIVSTRKAVADENFFGSPQTSANQLSGLMPVNYTPNACVSRCLRVSFMSVEISIRKPIDSQLVNTISVASKKLSCPFFNEQNWNVNFEASTLQADK